MGLRWLKMDKMTAKIPQDGAKMRKMRDVSSVGAPWRSYDAERAANNAASQGPGEFPPLGWAKPSQRQLQNPYSKFFAYK